MLALSILISITVLTVLGAGSEELVRRVGRYIEVGTHWLDGIATLNRLSILASFPIGFAWIGLIITAPLGLATVSSTALAAAAAVLATHVGLRKLSPQNFAVILPLFLGLMFCGFLAVGLIALAAGA